MAMPVAMTSASSRNDAEKSTIGTRVLTSFTMSIGIGVAVGIGLAVAVTAAVAVAVAVGIAVGDGSTVALASGNVIDGAVG